MFLELENMGREDAVLPYHIEIGWCSGELGFVEL